MTKRTSCSASLARRSLVWLFLAVMVVCGGCAGNAVVLPLGDDDNGMFDEDGLIDEAMLPQIVPTLPRFPGEWVLAGTDYVDFSHVEISIQDRSLDENSAFDAAIWMCYELNVRPHELDESCGFEGAVPLTNLDRFPQPTRYAEVQCLISNTCTDDMVRDFVEAWESDS